MKISARKAAVAGMLATSALAMVPAQAQDDVGARKSVFTVGMGLDAGHNIDLQSDNEGTNAQASLRLGYSYAMNTGATELSFGASVNPELRSGANTSSAQPDVKLALTHRSARSELSFGLSYRRSQITDQSIAYDETGAPYYYEGSGERGVASLSAKFTGGIDSPIGYSLGLTHSETDYYNLTGSSENPSQRSGISFGLRADLSSTRQLGLSFAHNLYDVENADSLQRRTDSVSLRLDQRLNAVTSLGLSVGRSRVETERSGITATTEGTTYGLSLTREDPRGKTVLGYDRSIGETGSRDEVTLARSTETKLGSFDGSIGFSRGESGGTDVIAGLGYERSTPRDTLNLGLTRAVRTDDDGEDVVVTRFTGQIAHDLSEVNSVNFGLTASLTDATAKQTTRVDGTLTYSHELTPDVDLSAGVRLGLSERSSQPDADRQAVFLSINRRFETLR